MKRIIQLLTLAVGLLLSIHSVHAQYPYYQQALLNERVGFGTVTGGAGGELYWVTNFNDSGPGSLRDGLAGDTPRWIMFAVSGNFYPASRIYMGSNKTIDGRGASVSIFNYGFVVQGTLPSRNIIFENLNMKGGTYDGIEVADGGGDVWIDHCSFNGWSDEAIGVTRPVATAYSDVTISWCKFFSQDKAVLIGGIVNDVNGPNMRVTLHHNWFNGTNQRHPRIRRAKVHAFNNYMVNWVTNGMVSSEYAQLATEYNIFQAGSNPTAVVTNFPPEPRGYARNTNNWKLNGATDPQYLPGSVFSPASFYGYTPEAANATLRTKIQTRAGATRSLGGFANMSTRANVQSGEGILVSGMYISGPAGDTKKVVIRAIGPSLAPWFPSAMGNPVLRVYNSAGQQIAYNDNWGDSQYAELQASGVAPSHYLEAAVILTLTPGSYTAMIDGWGTGIASIEVYDVDTSGPSKLVNISSRATVDPSNPPIAGLICDSGMSKVIFRGIGPTLANAGIQNPISDPTLALHDANGTQIYYNNNWQDSQAAAIQQTGVAPSDWREAAILIDLGPGSYTAILRDYWNAWGIGSIEIYEL
jgi:pectate lyase